MWLNTNKKVKTKQPNQKMGRISCSWFRRINIVKMTLWPNAIYGFNAIPSKLTMAFFTKLEQKNFTIFMETQKTSNSQSNLEKEEWSGSNQLTWFQTILKSFSHQDSMVLAQKQIYRSMEQDRNPRDKPTHLWAPYLWQRKQKYTTGKR